MAKIRINASDAGFRKRVSSAQEEFLRHCRLRNLSPRTQEYYRENLSYIRRVLKLEYVDELTKDRVDDLVDHEMNKGNKVVAINSRIRGLQVFIHFCAEREYLDDFKYPLMKVDQEQKEPYERNEWYERNCTERCLQDLRRQDCDEGLPWKPRSRN